MADFPCVRVSVFWFHGIMGLFSWPGALLVCFCSVWDLPFLVRFGFAFKIMALLVLVGTYPSIFPVARTLVPYA